MTALRRARLPPLSWIEQPVVQRLFDVFSGGGEEFRAVGGAVRNALLSLPVKDIDFATTATPDVVMARAEAAGLKSVPTGYEHGTVTVIAEGRPFEVTTLRADVETDGRRAKVVFGRDWRADAERRDFTMNALYAERDGGVFDPLGGYDDLCARRVRFIGDPQRRILEDALRILRFFRLNAEFGEGPVDADGLWASIRERRGIERLSRERVRQELLRLLRARRAVFVVNSIAEAGLLPLIVKGVAYPGPFARLVSTEESLGLDPDPLLRLGALAVRIEEDADRLAEALRLAGREAALLRGVAELWRAVPFRADERSVERFLYYAREKPAAKACLFAWAVTGADPAEPAWRSLYEKAARWRAPGAPFRGAQLVARGLRPGPALGAALARLESVWVDAGFPRDRVVLDRLVSEVLDEADQRAGT